MNLKIFPLLCCQNHWNCVVYMIQLVMLILLTQIAGETQPVSLWIAAVVGVTRRALPAMTQRRKDYRCTTANVTRWQMFYMTSAFDTLLPICRQMSDFSSTRWFALRIRFENLIISFCCRYRCINGDTIRCADTGTRFALVEFDLLPTAFPALELSGTVPNLRRLQRLKVFSIRDFEVWSNIFYALCILTFFFFFFIENFGHDSRFTRKTWKICIGLFGNGINIAWITRNACSYSIVKRHWWEFCFF